MLILIIYLLLLAFLYLEPNPTASLPGIQSLHPTCDVMIVTSWIHSRALTEERYLHHDANTFHYGDVKSRYGQLLQSTTGHLSVS